jgi:hypothetical protein
MDNYEINILRRNGNWKKINPKDFLLDTVEQDDHQKKDINRENKVHLDTQKQDDFLYHINQITTIIGKLESLEHEKTNLKKQLKTFENQFQSKKNDADMKIKLIEKETQMLDKTINIIKNLKNF